MANPIIAAADWARRRRSVRSIGRTAARLIPDLPWTLRVPDLGPLRVRLRRHRWYLYEEFGRSDDLAFGGLRRLIRPGDVVYDIGANIGVYARVMIQWMEAGTVIAFEPMTENLDLLQSNVRLGHLEDRVRVVPLALSDRDGTEDLQIDDVSSGTAVLSRVSGGKPSAGRQHRGLGTKTEQVEVARLDSTVTALSLPPPAVMKIDTEGAEAMVVRGGIETLSAHRPRLAIATHGEQPAHEKIELLRPLGYACFGFARSDDDGGGRTWRELTEDDAGRLADNNILASMEPAELTEPIEAWSFGG
jgi:FkbM family methyltransferase